MRAAIGRTRALEGLRFVVGTPLLRIFFVIWTVGGFLIAPLASVVLPAYVRRELGGAGDLAAAVTAYGLGGLVGTLAFELLGRRVARRIFFVAMWLVYPALCWLLVPLPGRSGLVALLFAIGWTSGAYDPFEVTIHQEVIPPELRARAFAVLMAAEMSVVPMSMLLVGFVSEGTVLRAGSCSSPPATCSSAPTRSRTAARGGWTRSRPRPRRTERVGRLAAQPVRVTGFVGADG